MLTTPFLTRLDPRQAVKGSRDPLGVQAIWTRFGRHVVGNLTTVSTSARDFTVLLLGYYFTEQLAADTPGSELSTFLKWEQLAAYARAHVHGDFAFRGTERVRKALSEGARVTLSDDQVGQILSNQKIYGLWGLYTVPGKASSLLEGDPTRLTPAGRDLVESLYLPALEEAGGPRTVKRIGDLLREGTVRIDVTGTHERLVQAVGAVLGPRFRTKEREVFREHLLFGGPDDRTQGRQRLLAHLLAPYGSDASFAWSPQMLTTLEKRSRSAGLDGEPLAGRLARIRVCESVIAPSTAILVHLLGMDGKPVADAVDRLAKEWGHRVALAPIDAVRDLESEFGGGDVAAGSRWVAIGRCLNEGDYRTLVDLLIEQNRIVMDARGSAAWIEVGDGKFHVRFREERGELPHRDALPTMWRYSYFLDPLRSMVGQIGVPA